MPRPAERVPMLAEKGAGQPPQQSYPVGQRLQPLDEHKLSSKSSGATPAGALTRPRENDFTHIQGSRLYEHPSTLGDPPRKGERKLYCSMPIKVTKGHRRGAVERYKHVATYVAIFPVLGRSERRRKAPSPRLTQQRGC